MIVLLAILLFNLPAGFAWTQTDDKAALADIDRSLAQVRIALTELDKAGASMLRARALQGKASPASPPSPMPKAPPAPPALPALDAKTLEKQCLAAPPSAPAILKRAQAVPADLSLHGVDLQAYYKCRALVEKSDAPCAALRPLCLTDADGKCDPMDGYCTEDASRDRVAAALLQGSLDAARLCAASSGLTPNNLRCMPDAGAEAPGGKLQRTICDIFVSNLSQPPVWKDKILKHCTQKPDMKEVDDLLMDLRALAGDEKACDSSEVSDCKELALLRKARQAKDPALCGKAPVCLWGMGVKGPAVCDPYLRQAQLGFCRAEATRRISEWAKLAETATLERAKQAAEMEKARLFREFEEKKGLKPESDAGVALFSKTQETFLQQQNQALRLLNQVDSILDMSIIEKDSEAPRQRRSQRNAYFRTLDAIRKKYSMAGGGPPKPVRRVQPRGPDEPAAE